MEFVFVDFVGVDKDIGVIDNGGVFFVVEEDFVGVEIIVWVFSLYFVDGGGVEVEFVVDVFDVFVDWESGYVVGVVGDIV